MYERIQDSTSAALDEISSPIHRLRSLADVLDQVFQKHPEEAKKQQESLKGLEAATGKFIESGGRVLNGGRKMVQYTSEEDAGYREFAESTARIFKELEFITTFSKEAFALIEQVGSQGEAIKPLLNLEHQLSNTFKPLKLLRLMFLIESANLPDDKKEIFVSLTYDIKNLHDSAEQLSNNEFSKFADVSKSIEMLLSDLSGVLKEDKRLVEAEDSPIHRLLSGVDEVGARRVKGDFRLEQSSEAVTQYNSRLTQSVQRIRTNQGKIHELILSVRHILDKLQEYVEDAGETSNAALGAEIYTMTGNTLDKMRHLVSETDNEMRALKDSVIFSLENVTLVEQESYRLQESRLVTAQDGDVVTILMEALGGMKRMIQSTSERIDKAYVALRPFSNISTDITDALQGITKDLRVVVFNAHLKASRTGGGTGLQALTSKVSDISDEANRLSLKIGSNLNQVAEGLSTVVSSFRELLDQGQEQMDNINDISGNVQKALFSYRDQLSTVLHEVSVDTFNLRQASDVYGLESQKEIIDQDYLGSLMQALDEVISVFRDTR